MLSLILAAAAPLLAPPCRPAVTMTDRRTPARIRPLGAEPPATQALAVYREVRGCNELKVVRRDVGRSGR